jgi:hypothetical protein
MIHLHAPDWPSTRLLRELLHTAPPCPDLHISWGVVRAGALNGMPKLHATAQLRAFEEAGLRYPAWTGDPNVAKTWLLDGKHLFGRRLHHTRGNDIIGATARTVIQPRSEFWNRDFWVQVVEPVHQEWRLHVFDGKVIARGLKICTGPQWRKQPVRNRNNGWTMRHDVDPPKGLRRVARRAVEACGYDFGAVDLLVLRDAPELTADDVVVLEVNSAPGVDRSTATAYIEAMIRYATTHTHPAHAA